MRKSVMLVGLTMVIVFILSIFLLANLYKSGEQEINMAKQDYPSNLFPAKNLEKGNALTTNIWLDNEQTLTLAKNKKVKYLFVDVGDIGQNGKFTSDDEEIQKFLDFIQEFENKENYNFIILPYTDIDLAKYSFDDNFQDNLISEYSRMSVLGFDGAFVDIENIPQEERINYLVFLERLNEKIEFITVYPGAISETPNNWEWEPEFFEQVSNRVDLIAVSSYDSGINDEKEYKEYLKEQLEFFKSKDWNANLILAVPTHNPEPETLENVLDVYKDYENTFIGVDIFAEWTITSNEWDKIY